MAAEFEKDLDASIKAAAKGLDKFENLLMGKEDSLEIESCVSCVYMKLICKTYFVEVKKARMSILSLLSFCLE